MSDKVAVMIDQILRAIRIFFTAGMLVEIRAPKAGRYGTISGYFNDFEKLAKAACDWDGKAPGLYLTLNPVLPELLARSANRAQRNAKDTTTDAQIVERRWVLIDSDPKRPSGISATDAEHEAALERARQIRDRLRQEGWPEPVMVDSGNGAHLLYRCNLPNDPAATNLVQRVLKALAARHDDGFVGVDQTTFNAARISKIPGTRACKGDSLPERPHRISRLLDVPNPVIPVSRELLEKLAAEVPETAKVSSSKKKGAEVPQATKVSTSKKKGTTGSTTANTFDIDAWIDRFGIDVVKPPVAHDGGRKWQIRCPFNLEHDNAAIFEAADGRLGFHCFHNSCVDHDWHALRAHLEPEYQGATGEQPNPTDVGNAKRFVARHGGVIRYCHPWQKWLIWDGRRWCIDDTGQIERLAKETVKAIFAEALTLSDDDKKYLFKHALKSEHEQRIKAMIALARSERGVPVRPSQLDRHPFLLNVENGTLNLQTGQLQDHRKEDLITKLAPVAYRVDATAPIFTRFMVQIMRGRRHMIRYIQRALGYALTGSTKEQVFFVWYGTGANGKTTALNIIHEMLGPDFSKTTPADTFTVKAFGDGIPNDLAQLKGARFVTAAEVEGKKLDEAKLKRMTGQDPISARFMRAEWFQYVAQFKIFFACNLKPNIESAGFAMWRRIRLIVFDVQIKEPDMDLPGKLRQELPGILAWCVRGCMAWQKFGLGTPDTVVTATAAYKQEIDEVGRFLADCTQTVPGTRVPAKDLYAAYRQWCQRADENLLSQQRFGRKLTERGLHKIRGGADGAYAYVDMALLSAVLNDLNDPKASPITPLESSPIGVIQKSVQTERSSFSGRATPSSSDPADGPPKEWVS
jgi:putative DNA primase/helicase